MGSFERPSCYFLNPEMGSLGACLTALPGLLGGVRQESGLGCTPAPRLVSLSLSFLSRSSLLRWSGTPPCPALHPGSSTRTGPTPLSRFMEAGGLKFGSQFGETLPDCVGLNSKGQ